MADSAGIVRESGEGSLLDIKVRPSSTRRGLEGIQGGRLVVTVCSPPEKGKANREALRVLAQELSLPPSRLEVVRGHATRNKTVLLKGVSLRAAVSMISRLRSPTVPGAN